MSAAEHLDTNPLRDAALAYAARGWLVFAAHAMTSDGQCSCLNDCGDSAAKHPRVFWKREATTDADLIRGWWSKWPGANVGVTTGIASGLFVFDVDTHKGGAQSLIAIEKRYGKLPITPTVRTGGGGWHYYFAHPGGEITNSSAFAGYAGIDTRGDGGYVIATPSNHKSGGVYRFLDSQPFELALAPVPAWLLDLNSKRKPCGPKLDFEPQGWDGNEPEWLGAVLGAYSSVRKRFERDTSGLTDTSSSAVDMSLASLAAIRAGLTGEQLELLLRVSRSRAELPSEGESYYRHTVGKALASAQADAQAKEERAQQSSDTGDGDTREPRHEIVLTDRQLDDVVADSVAALVAANDPPTLFLRGGAVVSIRRDEDGRPIIADVPEPAIVERLACAALWFKVGRKETRTDAGPTASLASTVLQRLLKHADALPPLRGVTESPLLRADGSILDREGYDPATRLYYAPAAGFTLARVPEQPTGAEIEHARGLLDEILCDFPTVTDGDYATAFGALLMVPLRELVSGCVPAHLYDTPAPGTGKGLLADAGAVLATGGLGAKTTEPDARSDDEWRKRITAMLLEGRAVAVLDNVERPIGSPSLAAALTTAVWSDRVLGSSRMLTLPNRTVWIITGNNLRLRGDLPRRCVWCRLDAKVARPWTRGGFRHPDLIQWVREQRGELLAGVFTLARAWIAAGRPEPGASTPRLGSFEGWRHVIGGTLRIAGVAGFLGNVEQLYAQADEDTPAWAGFLVAWQAAYGGNEIPVSRLLFDVRAQLPIGEELPPELVEMLDKPATAAKRVALAIKRKVETRFVIDEAGNTLRIVRSFDAHTKAARWSVQP